LTAVATFVAAVLTGTFLDGRHTPAPNGNPEILVADLHIHPYPGDGSLPVWELQHEAQRRGLDVIAITAHNNRVGLVLDRELPFGSAETIVIPGQEITTPTYHLIALGTRASIDWRLTAREAIAAVHAQGGVAIAAHPTEASWRENDEETLRTLDGTEVAHPGSRDDYNAGRDEFLQFFLRVRSINHGVAPIGSSDFHMYAPMGLCRTYVFVEDRTPGGVLEAIRRGRTVAADPHGRMFGADEDIEKVREFLSSAPTATPTRLEWLSGLVALLALAVLAIPLNISS
jgi:hypothetical protein